MEEDIPIEHPWVTKAIERAQKRVEEQHFEMRKNILKFDDVMETQRQTIYDLRDSILDGDNLKETILGMVERVLDDHIQIYFPEATRDTESDLDGFVNWFAHTFGIIAGDWEKAPDQMNVDELREYALNSLSERYQQREAEMSEDVFRQLERAILLDRIDSHWKEHLYNIDYIREGIHLRGYAGKDPIVVFKNESFGVFEEMYRRIEEEVAEYIYKAQFQTDAPSPREARRSARRSATAPPRRAFPQSGDGDVQASAAAATQQAMGGFRKVGRNEPCPCGSGKKFKKCHGK